MLTSLHIQDFAIIEELEVDFASGLTVMTGETGAGKTIILQALNLLLGARASTDVIRTGKNSASVTASFNLPQKQHSELHSLLASYSIECNDELIVRRLISASGKSKVSINGIQATKQMLKSISIHLVDVSSQHENQLLLDAAQHVKVIDRFGGHGAELKKYSIAFNDYGKLKAEIESLEIKARQASEQADFLQFQYDELNKAELKEGEEEELEAKRKLAKHAVDITYKTREAETLLYQGSGSIAEQLSCVSRLLSSCSEHDEKLQKWQKTAAELEVEAVELSRDLSVYADQLHSNPQELEGIEERLHLIRSMKRKYGGTVEACLERFASLKVDVNLSQNFDEVIADKRAELARLATALQQAGKALSERRKLAATTLAQKVVEELAHLGMKKTTFLTYQQRRELDQWDSSGPDEIEFLISSNVGEIARPMAKIASGGELSRILLVIKRALADKAGLAATYIFDEVDSGIGGATAEAVGKKLKEVSTARQVICITHLPQVASLGDQHFLVAKKVEKGRTATALRALAQEERLTEIARMLGGKEITATVRKHAQEMLRR